MTAVTRTHITRYNFHALEAKWRLYWAAIDVYRTGSDPDKPNIYILDYFPYPSGDGLSVGHCRNYVPTCVSARFHRMRGYNVLHPMGWDAFGLPAENYAIAHGIHPSVTTARFVANYRRQMQLVECSYDWSREINSTDPAYYRWTQWFFLLLHKRGLAYRAEGSQWWCPQCRTILANEQVEAGRCWRCDSEVTRKNLEQWYFRITAYADRLLSDLDTIDWPERIKDMQRHWIGRSDGALITFRLTGADNNGVADMRIEVFTTRPDTLFGATFLVLAPEHELVERITTAEHRAEVAAYVAAAQRKTEIDRMSTDDYKTGVFTGAYAVHPLSGEPIPVWIADYVLVHYGTGAIMAVPGHDARDHYFARRYELPIKTVVVPALNAAVEEESSCFTGFGTVVNSGSYSGQSSTGAAEGIIADLAAKGLGQAHITYRMRDWLISRQRYWGAPIPIIHCPACGEVPVPEDDLPVLLPEEVDFTPSDDERSPLARVEAWVNTTCPQCGGAARRETDTMDGFACSSWYFLRFASPHEQERPFDPEAVRQWLPVDVYVGGAEHAVMHLLYARFWTKVIHDAGLIDFVEPFSRLLNQGMLLSPQDGRKMSKSKGNVITPDEIVAHYGVDALRMYLLFLGPFEANALWNSRGIVGVQRFLERFWKLAHEAADTTFDAPEDKAFERLQQQTIRRVTRDMERFRYNTAVAALMEYLNALYIARDGGIGSRRQWRDALRTMALLTAPITPFIAEEIWQAVLQEPGSVHQAGWPAHRDEMPGEEHITIAVQVNGKLRERLEVDAEVDADELKRTVLENERVQALIGDKGVKAVIVVPGRLVNVVTKAK